MKICEGKEDKASLRNFGRESDRLLQPHWFDGSELPDHLEDIVARNEDDSDDN